MIHLTSEKYHDQGRVTNGRGKRRETSLRERTPQAHAQTMARLLIPRAWNKQNAEIEWKGRGILWYKTVTRRRRRPGTTESLAVSLRPIRLAPVPIFSLCVTRRALSPPFPRYSPAPSRTGTDGDGSAASSNPEPNAPTIRRKFQRSYSRATSSAELTPTPDFRGECRPWLRAGLTSGRCPVEIHAIGYHYRDLFCNVNRAHRRDRCHTQHGEISPQSCKAKSGKCCTCALASGRCPCCVL